MLKTSKRKLRIQNKWLVSLILLTMVTVAIATVAVLAEGGTSGVSISITYTDGTYGSGTETGLFNDVSDDVITTVSGTLILPGAKFSDTVSLDKKDGSQLDTETFYFDVPAEGQDYSNLWAYTFTGWKIAGATDKIPGETVFQPGDVIRPDTLEAYAQTGTGGTKTLTLEALWGKCYFIRNPYANMEYKATLQVNDKNGNAVKDKLYVLQIPTDGTPLSSDANTGNDPTKPKATIDGLYASIRAELGANETAQRANPLVHDAYARVVMLVGDLDYYTDSNQPESKVYGYAAEYDASTGNAIAAKTNNNVVPVAATYKSLGDKVHTYYYKPRNYSNTVYGNLRFDNVNFRRKATKWGTQDNGIEFQLYEPGNVTPDDSYIEFTARYNLSTNNQDAISTFRPSNTTYVVVNGGNFAGMQNQYGSSVLTGKQLYWTIGRKAKVDNLYCGTTSAYENNVLNLYYNYKVYILGGRISNCYGGNMGINTIAAGMREFVLYGDGVANSERNPVITNFYGGSPQSRLFGDISVKAYGCTRLNNVYGGGQDYSATTYGNITVELTNCTLAGDLYGGGQYGNCEITPNQYIQYAEDKSTDERDAIGTVTPLEELSDKFGTNFIEPGKTLLDRYKEGVGGNVTLKLSGTKVQGNVFGSGMGQTQILDVRTQMGIVNGEIKDGKPLYWYNASKPKITKEDNIYPAEAGDWTKPITGYPSYDKEDGRVFVDAWRTGTYTTNALETMSYYNHHSYAYLSLATVRNVTITITNGSEIGTSTNGKGNVYGGGSIAKVLENTEITITDSTVWGSVYGGGDGVTTPSTVKVYWPENDGTYVATTTYSHAYYTGTKGDITWHAQTPDPANKKSPTQEKPYKAFLEYTWSNDTSLIADPTSSDYGIDHEKKLLYSPNTQGLGSVVGNTHVIIDGTTVVHKDVYGGGNQGDVNGNITVEIKCTDAADTVNIEGAAYGGCNAANVGGDAKLTISGGTVQDAYGGNNLKGDITGEINTTLSGGKIVDKLFGGGNKADYNGITNLLISGGKVGELGDPQSSSGTVTGCAYGGGREATVWGAHTTISGGKLRAFVGGSLRADITPKNPDTDDAIAVYISGANSTVDNPTKITTFMGGNDMSGNVGGNIRIVVGLGKDNLFKEGTTEINAEAASDAIEITNFFGGGNAADYTYGDDWTIPDREPEHDKPIDGYKGITITSAGGKIFQVFGGGVKAKVTNVRTAIYDGVYHFLYGGGYEGYTKTTATHIRGGDFVGEFLPENQKTDPTHDQGGYIFGGGYKGYTANAIVHIEEHIETAREPDTHILTVAHSVFGGGNKADSGHTKIVMKSGEVVGSIYGGGFEGKAGANQDGSDDPDAMAQVCLYGGEIGSGSEGATSGYIYGHVYGGGYRGVTYHTLVEIAAWADHKTTTELKLYGNVFGGGHEGDVIGDTKIHFFTGHIDGNIYGGGRNGDVKGNENTTDEHGGHTHVDFMSGSIGHRDADGKLISGGNVYGGGLNGTVEKTHVLISDDTEVIKATVGEELEAALAAILAATEQQSPKIQIYGSVFGGGEGVDATVYDETTVLVDTKYDLTVLEAEITTGETTEQETGSGAIKTVLDTLTGDSKIHGNVYGGGDLGMVGRGSLVQGANSANITSPGITDVHIDGGIIYGSVFGGGRGVPRTGNYEFRMGAVLGRTKVTVHGGYIEGSVFGGGTQSRVYAPTGERASHVQIDENGDNQPQTDNKIALGGSVFGGGERGSTSATNATIPTTLGDVLVEIIGSEVNAGSKIYFLGDGKSSGGGVYGDGSLCLVEGNRTVLLKNFRTANEGTLKTFFSLQRADLVTLDNSAVVLNGAVDLVEEGDTTVYSINRVGKLSMENGSTFKLDRIVKYLGELTSDVETEREFIDKGHNGENDYIVQGGSDPENKLTDEDIDNYHNGTLGNARSVLQKNIVCVANGLYLEVISEASDDYGPVTGLFTLELLHANPGEGGGFVYGQIDGSTGDFICETVVGYTYKAVEVTADTFDLTKHYIRELGKGYVLATKFVAGTLYYVKEDSEDYMKVVDNVGGEMTGNEYEYYVWYIAGPNIRYTANVTGYIGDERTSFSDNKTVPEHDENLQYVLFGIAPNGSTLKERLEDGTYRLEQTDSGLTGQEIALELKLGGDSLGFLTYTTDSTTGKITSWGIFQDTKTLEGYGGTQTEIGNNVLARKSVDQSSNTFSIILHKSPEVKTEQTDMSFTAEIELYNIDNTLYAGGTSILTFDVDVAIIRIQPTQSVFSKVWKEYTGASEVSTISITGESSFTAHYITKYFAAAFPKTTTNSMKWQLSVNAYSYYMDANGHYLTLDADGEMVAITSGKHYSASAVQGDEYMYKDGDTYYCNCTLSSSEGKASELEYRGESTASSFPLHTRITMIDLTNGKRNYYYYLVESGDLKTIDLNDFMAMGTTTKISQLGEESVPEFMLEYNKQGSSTRSTESLVFIFDFLSAEWGTDIPENGESMSFTLKHLYGNASSGVDIMDHVKSGTDDAAAFIRAFPALMQYSVKDDESGLLDGDTHDDPKFEDEKYYNRDIMQLVKIDITENPNWTNTLFDDGKFTMMVELLDGNSADAVPVEFPIGIRFRFEGKEYHVSEDRKYVIIPLETVGNWSVEIENLLLELYSAAGGNAPSNSKAYFRLTVYAASHPEYYNAFLIPGMSCICEYTIVENPTYRLDVESKDKNQIYSVGESVTFKVDASTTVATGAEDLQKAELTVALQRKGSTSASYDPIDLNSLFTNAQGNIKNGEKTWTLRPDAAQGTYRLVFRYAERVEYLYFIIY